MKYQLKCFLLSDLCCYLTFNVCLFPPQGQISPVNQSKRIFKCLNFGHVDSGRRRFRPVSRKFSHQSVMPTIDRFNPFRLLQVIYRHAYDSLQLCMHICIRRRTDFTQVVCDVGVIFTPFTVFVPRVSGFVTGKRNVCSNRRHISISCQSASVISSYVYNICMGKKCLEVMKNLSHTRYILYLVAIYLNTIVVVS